MFCISKNRTMWNSSQIFLQTFYLEVRMYIYMQSKLKLWRWLWKTVLLVLFWQGIINSFEYPWLKMHVLISCKYMYICLYMKVGHTISHKTTEVHICIRWGYQYRCFCVSCSCLYNTYIEESYILFHLNVVQFKVEQNCICNSKTTVALNTQHISSLKLNTVLKKKNCSTCEQ